MPCFGGLVVICAITLGVLVYAILLGWPDFWVAVGARSPAAMPRDRARSCG
jgi:hypothetical protein